MREVKTPPKPEIHLTMVDRLVAWWNPVRGQARVRARAMMAFAGGYTGASRKRRSLSEWSPGGGSADADLLPDLATLRERSRDLVRNDPIAGGAIHTKVTNVVGTGLKVKSTIDADVLGMDDAAAEEWERAAEREFRLWAESEQCDITATQTFADLQELVFRSTLENGDIFALLPFRETPGFPFGIRLQLIEADRVVNPNGQRDTPKLSAGVEKDDNGRPLRIHIRKVHPGELGRVSTETDAVEVFSKNGRRRVLHIFRRVRIGQSRGVPDLAPVIESLKQLSRYSEAELMAAVVSGMFTVFIKTANGDANISPMDPTSETGGSSTDEDYKMGNGAIVGLAPDEDITTANPGRPNTAFDPFVQAILRQIGAALELPFEVLLKHFTASYSASRAAFLEAWRFFNGRRSWLVRVFCQPVYEAVIEEAIARGRLAAPGFFDDPLVRKAYLGTTWTGDAPGQIDEEKAVKAAEKRLAIGVSTLAQETAGLTGGDWERNHRQQVKEKAARKAGDLTGAAPNAEPPAPDNTDQTDPPDDGGDNETA